MAKKVILEHNDENLYPIGIGPRQSYRWHTVTVDTPIEGKFTSTSDSGKTYSTFVVNGGTGIGLIDAPEVKVVRQKTQLAFLSSATGTSCLGVMNISTDSTLKTYVRTMGDYYNTTSNTISPLEDIFFPTQSIADSSVAYSNAAHHSVTLAGSVMHFTVTWIKSTITRNNSAYDSWSGYVKINGSQITYGVDEEIQCAVPKGRTPIAYWRGANLNTLREVHSSLEILESSN